MTADQILKLFQAKLFGRQARQYTSIDLIRFYNFKKKIPEKIPTHIAIKMYNNMYPELSAREQLKNLAEGLNAPWLLNNLDKDENEN